MTVAEIIQVAKASQYLSANAFANGDLYGNGHSSQLSRKIYCVRKNVEWLYELDPDDETLIATANYLYALCEGFNLQASVIVSAGGGGAIVVPGGGGGLLRSPILVTGADFSTATRWNGTNSSSVTVASSYNLQVFYNPASRFLTEGSEWTRTSTGIEILLAGFDAQVGNIDDQFYIYLSL